MGSGVDYWAGEAGQGQAVVLRRTVDSWTQVSNHACLSRPNVG